MSKKDYQAVARAIYRTRQQYGPGNSGQAQAHHAIEAVMLGLVDVFAAGSPRFDADRFREACETGKTCDVRRAAGGLMLITRGTVA
jgi:hypothetical protein